MKIQNITDVEGFFKVIDSCKGPVELLSPEGDRINLKSKLSQYLSMATMFSNGYINELELVAHEKDDVDRLIKYMYQGE
ncbi:polya polymerase [Lachnoclostridium sp. An14]|uniref:polya polymerase n=1 Tax=Lachnoclostridium sp. An14 TaxID=1965562 RepID=UPI000B39D452|nr:polya polymerase [Lachnoclostridium sp. An14]OUQ21938.1 polya polymerase [Lachnoclostridium sp. An14]